jgi:YVTN family beta-propeller protein
MAIIFKSNFEHPIDSNGNWSPNGLTFLDNSITTIGNSYGRLEETIDPTSGFPGIIYTSTNTTSGIPTEGVGYQFGPSRLLKFNFGTSDLTSKDYTIVFDFSLDNLGGYFRILDFRNNFLANSQQESEQTVGLDMSSGGNCYFRFGGTTVGNRFVIDSNQLYRITISKASGFFSFQISDLYGNILQSATRSGSSTWYATNLPTGNSLTFFPGTVDYSTNSNVTFLTGKVYNIEIYDKKESVSSIPNVSVLPSYDEDFPSRIFDFYPNAYNLRNVGNEIIVEDNSTKFLYSIIPTQFSPSLNYTARAVNTLQATDRRPFRTVTKNTTSGNITGTNLTGLPIIKDWYDSSGVIINQNRSSINISSIDYSFSANNKVSIGNYVGFLNSVAFSIEGDTYGLYVGLQNKISQTVTRGAYVYSNIPSVSVEEPVYVTSLQAIRYINWIQNGNPIGAQNNFTTENGSYRISGNTVTDNNLTTANVTKLPNVSEYFKYAHFGRKNPADYSNLPYGKNSPPIFLRNASKTRNYISNIKNSPVFLNTKNIHKISSLTGKYALSSVNLIFGGVPGIQNIYGTTSSSSSKLNVKHVDTFSSSKTGSGKVGNYGIQLDISNIPTIGGTVSRIVNQSLTAISLTDAQPNFSFWENLDDVYILIKDNLGNTIFSGTKSITSGRINFDVSEAVFPGIQPTSLSILIDYTNNVPPAPSATPTNTPSNTATPPVTPTRTASPTPSAPLCGNNILLNSNFQQQGLNWNSTNVDIYRLSEYTVGADSQDFIVDLNALSPGFISQSFNTVVGQTYTVKFNLSANLVGGPRLRPMNVSVINLTNNSVVSSRDYTFDTNGLVYNGTMAAQGWQEKSFTFVSPATALSIKLSSTCSDCSAFGPVVDNVTICGQSPVTPTPTQTPSVTPSRLLNTSIVVDAKSNFRLNPASGSNAVNTGIYIDSSLGRSLSITATGNIGIGVGVGNGPAGLSQFAGVFTNPDGSKVTLNGGSLVGKIGANGNVFSIGASTTINPNVSGILYLGIFDGDGAYADNSGSFNVIVNYASTNSCTAGEGWVNKLTPIRVGKTYISGDGNVLFFIGEGAANGIYKSSNVGNTWSSIFNSTPGSKHFATSKDGTNLVIAVTDGSISTSSDGGANWTLNLGAGTRNWSSVAISDNGLTIYASETSGNGIYKSADGGNSWIKTVAPNVSWSKIICSASGENIFAFAATSAQYTSLSKDGGLTWTVSSVTTALSSTFFNSGVSTGPLAIKDIEMSRDGKILFVSAFSSFANGTLILISADFGASWKAYKTLPRFALSLKSSYDGNKVFAGFEGFIYTSSDSGVTWNERSSVGVGTWSSLDCSNNGQKAIACKPNSLLFSDCSIPLVTPTPTSTRTPTVSKSQTPTPTRTPGLILQNRNIPVGDGPIDIAINNNTNTLYVLNQNSNNITVLDSFTYSVITTIPVGTNPSGITFNKLTNKIYVSNTGNNSVSVIDTTINTVVKTIVLPEASGPKGIVVNPNTNRIFVGNSNSYTVAVIDGNTDSIISTISRPPSLTGAFAPDKLVLDSQNNTVYFYKSSMSLIGYIDDSISSSLPSTYSWTLLQFNTFAVSLQDIYAYNGSLFVYYLENFGDILCLSKILRSSLISDNSISIINTVLRIDSGGSSRPVSSASTRLIGIAQDTILLYNNNITTSLNQATTGRLLRVPTNFSMPSTISLNGIPANGTGVKTVKGNNDVFSDSRLFLLNYDKDVLDVVDILTFDTTPTPTPTITSTLTRTPTPTPTRCVYPNSIQNPDFKNVTNGKIDSWDFSSTGSSTFPYFDDVPKLFSSTSKSVAQLDSSGSISQAFNTIAGQVYQITFKYSANGSPAPAKQSFSVGFGGNISTTDYAITPIQGLTVSSFDFSSPVGDVFSYDNDPYINNVSLLLRGDGTSIVDTSNYKNIITNSSNVQLNTSQRITGTQSLYFDGSNNQYLSIPYAEQFNFGSGDFTVETWIKIDAFVQDLTVFGQFFGISLFLNNGDIGLYYGGTASTRLAPNNTIKTGKWTHLALTKTSGLIKIYIDGYSSGQAYLPGVLPPGTGDMHVGGYVGRNSFKGYIDDLRVTKGICRYKENFVPLHQNRTTDESVVKHWKYGKLFFTAPSNSSRISFVNSGTETVLIDDIVVCGVPNFTRTPTPTKTSTATQTPTKTGTQTPTPTQTPTILVDDSLNIKHFLGIRRDKKLMSWGYNNNGQLGLGDDLNRSVPTLFNIPNWKKIITNPYFTTKSAALAASNSWYGIKTNNTLWEWRELENTNSNILKTTNLESLSYITRDILDFTFKNSTSIYFVDANTRNLYSYDLVSRSRSKKPIIEEEVYSIVSISENYFAVLYNGPTNLLINLEGSDTFLKFNYTEYKKISANSRGTLFAIDNDDYLFGMGSNSFGQLGNNSQRESLFLSKIGNKTWIDVSSGQFHTLGIDTDGFAYAWGRNTDGELGDGTLTSRLVPTKINSAEDGWINIYAGTFYSIAKKYDLTLWAWGRNTENTLGTLDSTIVSSKTPILIPGTWKDIAVYDSSIFALGDTPPTPTPTNSRTPSQTPTSTATPTKTSTETPTPTKTPTSSITASKTPTPTSSETPTSTVTPTQTPTESPTPTQTPTESVTPTQTQTSSVTPTQTSTSTPTNTPTSSETPTPTSSLTPSKTPTNTPTSSVTPSQTPTMTATPTSSITPTPTETPTNTPTSTSTITPTVTSSQTPTPSITPPLRLFYYYISDSKADLCGNKEEGNVKTISVYDIDSSLQTTTFLYKDKDASTRWLFDDLNTRLGSSANRIYMVGITFSSISALVEDIDGYAIIEEQDISC